MLGFFPQICAELPATYFIYFFVKIILLLFLLLLQPTCKFENILALCLAGGRILVQ